MPFQILWKSDHRYRILFFGGREREPHFQILTLFFISKHMKMLYLKFNQNRITDENVLEWNPISKNVNFYSCSIVAQIWRYYFEIGSETNFNPTFFVLLLIHSKMFKLQSFHQKSDDKYIFLNYYWWVSTIKIKGRRSF